ncbi:hypothetical protein [Ectropis obliqua nucleopolyhedrovirus]|uniref:Putative 22.3 kDa protein n=1 Tax=Ectropis obliqua nucleopolyhedrovirus TaxID=59376 RepID=A0EYV8_9ABAC|nr:hypothetical protein EONV_gp055 [Ectropis obliqua nucleopolyhedrovirus]ABI35738.1 hypothetical protein [Ectropis obliqua nucleopolyhedrovirus]AGS47910.1 putative 22.3 kDa protein [Ectropis obliqua nucleopolyhedrovirus]QWV59676.1 hypothetical protein EONV_gp055 [Ectropis obliqua nucleopolyhedrovirus]UYO72853.1 hypothetical protein EONV-gp055 [Ectropis obliqua nucleopolyhedrovirus]
MIRWRMLNSDRVEVTPEDRQDAWQNLIVSTLNNSPVYSTYRTLINRANFENFDYKRPLIYEIGRRTLLINNEFLNRALNRPNALVAPLNVKSFHIALAYMCAVIITIIIAIVFNNNIYVEEVKIDRYSKNAKLNA